MTMSVWKGLAFVVVVGSVVGCGSSSLDRVGAPDGASRVCSSIAFASDRSGSINIHVMASDGTGTRQLTTYEGDRAEYGASWSPDSKQLLFVTYDRGWRLARMDSDGSGRSPVTQTPHYQYSPAWAPHGNGLAYVHIVTGSAPYYRGDIEIFIMDDTGGGARRLTDDPASAFEWDPAWSPSGDVITYTSLRGEDLEIFSVPVDGGEPVNLTNSPAADFGAAWSPSGSEIAFYSDRSGTFAVYLMSPDGSDQRQLIETRLTIGDDETPVDLVLSELGPGLSWSPDGSRLALVSADTGDYEIYTVARDGTGLRRLTDSPAADAGPAWCGA